MSKLLQNKTILIGVVAVVGVFSCIIVIIILSSVLRAGNNSNQVGSLNNQNSGIIQDASGKTYPCLMKASSELTKIGNQQFAYVVTSEGAPEWGEVRKDNGVRSLSLSEMQAGTSANHLFLIGYMPDGSYIQNNLTTTTQVCDKNNNTIVGSFLEDINVNPIYSDPSYGNSLSFESEITQYQVPAVKGTYRIDGLAFYNGRWVLVTRMDNFNLD